MPTPMTFIDRTEAVVEDVATELADIVTQVTERLMPDGRPFWREPVSEEEELRDYTLKYRGNPEAWTEKIRDWVGQIEQGLEGLPPEAINAAHPYDIAISYAYSWSYKMEQLLKEQGDAPRPTSLPEEGDDDEVLDVEIEEGLAAHAS